MFGAAARRRQDLQALGRIKHLKRRRPEVSIGVLGCMAQKDQGQILRRAPHVDVVVGPGQLGRVPELLSQAKEDGVPRMAVSLARSAARESRSRGASRVTTPTASPP